MQPGTAREKRGEIKKMTNLELKKEMYQELEKNGITKKQVSISVKGSMYDDIANVTIQDITLPKEKIENILKKFEEIRWDEHAQEILQGCNTYVNVDYNSEKIKDFRNEYDIDEKALKIYEYAKNHNDGNGVQIVEGDERFLFFFNDEIVYIFNNDGTQKHINAYGHHGIVIVLTNYMLGHYGNLEDYRKEKEEHDRLFEIELKKQKEEREIQEREREKELLHREKEIENLNKNSFIVPIEEKNQKTQSFKWAHLNKNGTLNEYIEEVKKGDFYYKDGKITHEWTFKDFHALDFLKNHLLSDYNQVKGLGGSDSDDPRLAEYKDVFKIPRELMQSVKWYNLVVAVIYDGKIQFVIDPQGYGYARYVGLSAL